MHATAAALRLQRKEKAEAEKKRIDEMKNNDGEAYLGNLYESRRVVLERMQQRAYQRE